MTEPIIECVPNFSEGRREQIINQIEASINELPGIFVLNRHSDRDHNRTVITFMGYEKSVEEAAYRMISCASRLIDMNLHKGEHPRIGATDVVPFIPLQDTPMETCIALAHRLGKRVGDDLKIPVYLYEEAAQNEARRNLANIRRGEFEGLMTEIKADPERIPDYGPRALSTAGATAIGARKILIAFNIFLKSQDLPTAQHIAKKIRFSSGGLPAIKAIGRMVHGLAQVSINLTDYKKTNIPIVYEEVKQEADLCGIQIDHSELVGLAPLDAILDSAAHYLHFDHLEKEQILDYHVLKASDHIFSE